MRRLFPWAAQPFPAAKSKSRTQASGPQATIGQELSMSSECWRGPGGRLAIGSLWQNS
jgi:hypothetical protein